MKNPLPISDVMTPCPYSIEASSTLSDALDFFATRDVRHLPVVDDGEVIGMLCKRDAQLSYELCEKIGQCPAAVRDIGLSKPYIISADVDVAEAAREMSNMRENCALVADDDGGFVGIFTTTDACRLLHLVIEESRSLENNTS